MTMPTGPRTFHRFAKALVLAGLPTIVLVCCADTGVAAKLSHPSLLICGTRLDDSLNVDRLEALLGTSDSLTELPRAYFAAYDKSLPDLIFAFPDSGKSRARARIALVENGKARRRLHGARFVWVLTIRRYVCGSGKDSSKAASRTEPVKAHDRARLVMEDALAEGNGLLEQPSHFFPDTVWVGRVEKISAEKRPTVSIERLDHQRGLAEVVFKDVLGGLLGVKAPENSGALPDTSQDLEWSRFGNAKGDTVEVGMVRFAVQENTVNRIRVQPEADGHRVAQATFGNYEGSPLGASIGLAAVVKGMNWSRAETGPYAIARCYLMRPRVPSEERLGEFKPRSLSIVLGVQVADLWKSYLAGISVGHIVGGAGLICPGFGLRRVGSGWSGGFAIGIDYAL